MFIAKEVDSVKYHRTIIGFGSTSSLSASPTACFTIERGIKFFYLGKWVSSQVLFPLNILILLLVRSF